MKIQYILLIISLLFCSCQSEQQQQRAKIQALENHTPDKLEVLLLAYEAYIAQFPDDKTQISKYLNNAQTLLDQHLTQLRAQTVEEQTGVVNQEAVQEFIQLAERYAALLPNAASTPEWLYQAGEVAGAVHAYDKTLALYQTINEKYPRYEKSSQVLFMRAFTLDNELGRYDEARPLYEAFLQQYPNDDLADDAAFQLENLGKSPEEIVRAFQERLQKQ